MYKPENFVPADLMGLPYEGDAAAPDTAGYAGRPSQVLPFYATQMGILEKLARSGVPEATTLIVDLELVDPEETPDKVDIAPHPLGVIVNRTKALEIQKRESILAVAVSALAKVATPLYARNKQDAIQLRSQALTVIGEYEGMGKDLLEELLATVLRGGGPNL